MGHPRTLYVNVSRPCGAARARGIAIAGPGGEPPGPAVPARDGRTRGAPRAIRWCAPPIRPQSGVLSNESLTNQSHMTYLSPAHHSGSISGVTRTRPARHPAHAPPGGRRHSQRRARLRGRAGARRAHSLPNKSLTHARKRSRGSSRPTARRPAHAARGRAQGRAAAAWRSGARARTAAMKRFERPHAHGRPPARPHASRADVLGLPPVAGFLASPVESAEQRGCHLRGTRCGTGSRGVRTSMERAR